MERKLWKRLNLCAWDVKASKWRYNCMDHNQLPIPSCSSWIENFDISIHINLSNIVFLIIFLFWLNFQEACITGVDALGFDARVCSGTQLQTLRFAFETPVCMMPLFQLTVLSYSPFLLCMESLQFATCFIFSFQATSEYSAEIQLNDLLFPKKKKPIRWGKTGMRCRYPIINCSCCVSSL